MNASSSWRPTISISNLRERARILGRIRTFFAEREVMEVETPALSNGTVTDEHLHSFVTGFVGPGAAGGKPLYLQTSPEYAMKRLLAAGSGPIYQICKAFRNEEAGRYHNPEFTMLEWYRPGFDHFELMDELDVLIQQLCHTDRAEKISYQQAFVDHLGLDPLTASMEALRTVAINLGHGELAEQETDRDSLLQLLFCDGVESQIGRIVPCFVYDFPASQAALARLNPDDHRVAQRFEMYFKGLELANGFHELTDPLEQQQRFEQDNRKREAQGRPVRAIDPHLLGALEAGLPDCAGVAVGVDRLVMLVLGTQRISEVLSFDVENA